MAVLLSSTALYSAFVSGSMPVATALTRFLIALPIAGGMVFLFTAITASYRPAEPAEKPDDAAADGGREQPVA